MPPSQAVDAEYAPRTHIGCIHSSSTKLEIMTEQLTAGARPAKHMHKQAGDCRCKPCIGFFSEKGQRTIPAAFINFRQPSSNKNRCQIRCLLKQIQEAWLVRSMLRPIERQPAKNWLDLSDSLHGAASRRMHHKARRIPQAVTR